MKRRSLSFILSLLALLGLLVLPLGCSFGASSSSSSSSSAASSGPTPTPIPTSIVPTNPTYTVQRGDVVRILQFSGRAAPVREEELFFRTNGYVEAVYARRNEAVKAGTLLAELEVTDLKNQITQAEAELTAVQMSTERNLAQADADVRVRELNLAKLQASISESQLLSARFSLERAQENLINAQTEYRESLERTWETEDARKRYAEAVRDAQQNLELAQASYNDALRARERLNYDIELAQLDLNLALMRRSEIEAGVDVTRTLLTIQRLNGQLNDARIVAPFDGVILSTSIIKGTQVQGYKPVMVIADPSELEITADLQDNEMSELAEGMTLLAEVFNRPGEQIPGTIIRLPYPYGSGGTIEGVQDEDKATHITLEKSPIELGMKVGDRVRITVELERAENTLWLPPQAVRTFEGRTFVVLQEGSGQRRVDVTIGIRSDDRYEILSGLSEGQVVIAP
ncbi:MAG TPA: efflux RND transporter periplasmic adaptor subunit [Anaerolineae bacterium]|nr:efflux RND transporter periplasmic adaptor subunit [Anaerolineae bacterium]HQK15035.1 efflux RND transporter periplasmic adaptor subunit [Anaerolineae bacterium]